MNQNNPEFWRQSAEQLQQTFASNWTTAMQSLQGMVPPQAQGGFAGMPAPLPQIAFSPRQVAGDPAAVPA